MILFLQIAILLLSLFTFVDSNDRKPTCQLPPFTNLMPLNSRRELRKIWAGFHSTSSAKKCERQLAQTRELISGLPEDVKLRILDFDRPESSTRKTTNGMTFLTGLSDVEVSRFSEIMANRSVTHDQRYDMLRSWASETLDLDAINQVEQFIVFKKRKDVSFKNKVDKLSSEARIAHDKLESLRRLKQEVYFDLTETAKRELAGLYRAKCPKGSIYEASDLDAEELQLACSIDDRMPVGRTTTTTTEPTVVTTPCPTLPPTSMVEETPSTTEMPTTTTTLPLIFTSGEPLWVRLPVETAPTTTDDTPKQLSFEIQKQIAPPSEKPKGVASMFSTDQEKLEDLLKRIFNTKNLRLL